MNEELLILQKFYNIIVEFLVTYSLQIVGAIIILIIGFKLAGRLGRLVFGLCEKHELDITLSRFLGNVVKITVLAFVIIIAIGKFGISIAPFIAAVGALAFGGSFALQGPLSNYGAGVSIILTRPFIVGNTITVQGVSGVVDEIRLAITILSTEDEEQITIPNKHILGEITVNSFANKIVETTVGISYDDDPHKAVMALQETLAGIPEVVREPVPQIGLDEFGDSSLNIGLRYWVETKKYFQSKYKVNLAIHQSLKEAGITIPFPRRDVRMLADGD